MVKAPVSRVTAWLNWKTMSSTMDRCAPASETDCPPMVTLAPLTVADERTGSKLNLSAAPVAEVPLGVVTVMSTWPADSAGATAKIEPSGLIV